MLDIIHICLIYFDLFDLFDMNLKELKRVYYSWFNFNGI